jgi:hypothetical protein
MPKLQAAVVVVERYGSDDPRSESAQRRLGSDLSRPWSTLMAPRPGIDDGHRSILQDIAKEAAKSTIQEFFFSLGYDLEEAEDRKNLIADLSFLRKQRETYSDLGSHILKVIAGLIAIASATALWQFWKPPG